MTGLNKIPVTVHGAKKMRDELHRLKTKDRYEVIQAISEARSYGDISENAEYEAAKERQSFIEGRIAELETKLSSAQIIDPTSLKEDGKIVFGATVLLENLDSGKQFRYQIVGNDEADLKEMKVSIVSPIARAMIGKYTGEVIEVHAPSGIREYEVLEVLYI
jgi:transcription elongation factor GreA